MDKKQLLILGCSQAKREDSGLLPAIDRYNGPMYQSLRKFLRDNQWPQDVSIAVLSAKYGLFGILKGIEHYNMKMNASTVDEKISECRRTLKKWEPHHYIAHLSLGKDYLPAIQPALKNLMFETKIFKGPIGIKRNQINSFLDSNSPGSRVKAEVEGGTGEYRYFLPDWDDLLDKNFDFEQDSFSGKKPAEREDIHCGALMRPEKMYDGILVSLAQQGTSKGQLRSWKGSELGALSPPPLRKHFGLSTGQYLFGDCGAFSYVNEDYPTISVEQAVSLYELHGFDFGASVDHIPVRKIKKNSRLTILSDEERQERVKITRNNAKQFIEASKKRKAGFNPVGTIQALNPEQYGQSVQEYYDLGYRHLAIGGLVPLKDGEIEDIVQAVIASANELKERPWIHLFGIFRPKLQDLFRELKIDSFDSASYFRKAWLRSNQNYIGANGNWYAALRVPMTRDGRTRQQLIDANLDIAQLEKEEREVLNLLCKYDRDEVGISEVLDAVLSYDHHLIRSTETQSMRKKYKETLEERPWRACECTFCKDIGIHILIFRGANRNKRRGAHNTLMLYRGVLKGRYVQGI